MTQTILLVSTATRWYGTARMPRALARAGFDVALIAPPDSLALASRYVARSAQLAANANPAGFLALLVRMVDATSPALLVPCDEMAVRLLFALVVESTAVLPPLVRARLVALVTRSLGDPRHYAASIDKTLLPAAATALGVRVPPYAIVSGAAHAAERAADLGYPVVLKRRFGFAGGGVAIVATPGELPAAATELLRPDPLDLADGRPRLLVQRFVRGPHLSQALVALGGVPLAGFGWERDVWTQPVKGQTAVLRFVDSRATRADSERLCRGMGISGFFNAQFIVDAATGEAQLLEINRRIVTHTHLGERVGADLPRALHAALDGTSAPPVEAGAGAGERVAIFPREWLRDPASPHLSELPVDVPWDDPGLLAAMLRLRHEG